MLRRNMMIGIIVMLGLVPFVWAFNLDNTKSYTPDDGYGTIEVVNSFGAGSTIAQYKLLENTDTCVINCHAIGTVELYDKDSIFEGFNFVDDKGAEVKIPYSVFIEVTEEQITIVPNYVMECTPNGFDITNNSAENCVEVQKGTKEITTYETYWKEYRGENLEPGTYKWKIEGQKKPDQKIDWRASALGVTFYEWAWWNNDWLYQRQLTITGTLTAGKIINVSLDTASLITAGKVEGSMDTYSPCDGLTVVYQDTTELNTTVLFCNTANSHILFNTQANDASGTNTDYKIYYGGGNNRQGNDLIYTRGGATAVNIWDYVPAASYKTGANALDKDDFYGYYTPWTPDAFLIDINEEDPTGAGNIPKFTVNDATANYFVLNFSSYCGSASDILTGYTYSPYNATVPDTHQVVIKGRDTDVVGNPTIVGADPTYHNITLYIGNLTEMGEAGYCGWYQVHRYPVTNLEAVAVAVGAETSNNILPVTPYPIINMTGTSNSSASDAHCNFLCEDDDAGDVLTYNITWLKGGNNLSSGAWFGISNLTFGNVSCSNGTYVAAELKGGNLSNGQIWWCSVTVFDSKVYTVNVNASYPLIVAGGGGGTCDLSGMQITDGCGAYSTDGGGILITKTS